MAFGSPDSFVISPKVYAGNFVSVYKILWHPDKSCIRDKVSRAAGRRVRQLAEQLFLLAVYKVYLDK
jgi:hypothetical protein